MPAGFAEAIVLGINLIDGCGKTHCAPAFGAMRQAECVPQFMSHLFPGANAQQMGIFVKAIEALPQPRQRHERQRTTELRLTEYERERRDEEVAGSNSQQSSRPVTRQTGET